MLRCIFSVRGLGKILFGDVTRDYGNAFSAPWRRQEMER